ncbi:hypothetical protein ABG79_01325 [Caloramator mitchellensis]|uniref:Alkaline shock response membrane anchor protein AmaP n=1 Tax=Caloramator mitchellensis TaxID=908809 RepID=A0A0R3K1S4_CALMK|nr:alkaline shock response membrane anchor protein AmaP [Caloramator mitchellensis]KRQ86834.1 hypothetical protein ABG79_01325 [Caloramator mitchellensis]
MNKFEKFLFTLYFVFLAFATTVALLAIKGIIPQEQINYYYSLTGSYIFDIIAFALIAINIYFVIRLLKTDTSNKAGIVKYTSDGEIVITNEAVKALVLKATSNIKGIKDIKVFVRPGKQNINIMIKMLVFPDINIPNLVKEIQQNVKSYIEMIAEIPVGEVKVLVDDIASGTMLKME